MKPVRYTDHGRDRMVERVVSEEEVESAMNDPAITLPDPLGRVHIIGYPPGRSGKGLHVIYSEDENDRWVVSVYWVGG